MWRWASGSSRARQTGEKTDKMDLDKQARGEREWRSANWFVRKGDWRQTVAAGARRFSLAARQASSARKLMIYSAHLPTTASVVTNPVY